MTHQRGDGQIFPKGPCTGRAGHGGHFHGLSGCRPPVVADAAHYMEKILFMDYEAPAPNPATDSSRLAELRIRLEAGRLTQPLLDTTLFARHLEAGYTMIRPRLEAGWPPDHLVIDRTATG